MVIIFGLRFIKDSDVENSWLKVNVVLMLIVRFSETFDMWI